LGQRRGSVCVLGWGRQVDRGDVSGETEDWGQELAERRAWEM
jgi:hypothetical protein